MESVAVRYCEKQQRYFISVVCCKVYAHLYPTPIGGGGIVNCPTLDGSNPRVYT